MKHRKVLLRTKQYSGQHFLSAWIDTPGNFAWSDKLLDYPTPTFDATPENYFNTVCGPTYQNCNKWQAASNVWGVLQGYHNDIVTPRFNAFKAGLSVVPSSGTAAIQIQESLLVPGVRYIYFQLTPRGLNPSNHWFYEGQFVSIAGNGDEAVMKEFDLSDIQPKYQGHKLGEPLPPVVMMVKVEPQ